MGTPTEDKLEIKIDNLTEKVSELSQELAGFKGRVWGAVFGISTVIGMLSSFLTLYFSRK